MTSGAHASAASCLIKSDTPAFFALQTTGIGARRPNNVISVLKRAFDLGYRDWGQAQGNQDEFRFSTSCVLVH